MNETKKINKEYLLKGLIYLYDLPPSKMDMFVFGKMKRNLLPYLITFIDNADEQELLPIKPQETSKIVSENSDIIT